MKKAIVMITAIILAIPAFAQSRIYRVVIVRLDGTSQKGALVGLNDSSISVIPLGEAKASTPKESVTIREFPVRSISELKNPKRTKP